jgi:hypothetical protein
MDGKVIEQIRLLSVEVGIEATIAILVILLSAGIIYALIRQASKHNDVIRGDNKKMHVKFDAEIVELKEAVAECHRDRDNHKEALAVSELRGEELNKINKENQKKVEEAVIGQQTALKMVTDLVDKFMDKLGK